MRVSVVIPAYNASATLGECLRALANQRLAQAEYEVIVVDDGSRDTTAAIARTFHPVRLIRQPNQGAPAARNCGIAAARAPWIAFTDADCIPSRGWLAALLAAVEGQVDRPMGVAGRTVGHQSLSPAAHYVDLAGGLDAERHLAHPTFPFAPSGNVLYRRDLLERVGGFDERFHTYDACDLHTRLCRLDSGPMLFAARAVVLHRHRDSWPAYFRQQRGYGYGYGQFAWHYRSAMTWGIGRELAAWWQLVRLGGGALLPGGAAALVRRGHFVKALAQRIGFLDAYYSPRERERW